MRKTLAFGALVGSGLLGWGCGDDGGGATNQNNKTGQPCADVFDCDDGNECTYEVCLDNICSHTNASGEPAPSAEQVPGDCMSFNCVDGAVEEVPYDDPPEDADGDCVIPVCEQGSAGEELAEVGELCNVSEGLTGACDAEGACTCTPTEGETVFVNPTEGTDDAAHGGGPGGCAVKTLTYALTVATRRIRLSSDDYSEASGETFPIVLSGNQELRCFDFSDEQSASITGSGDYALDATATIVLEGSNFLEDCAINAAGSTFGVVISGDQNDGTGMRLCSVTGAETGITVTPTGNDVFFEENNIQNNTAAGLAFDGPDKRGGLENNTFASNGADVTCTDPNNNLNGEGNSLGSCTGCANCPF